LTGTLSAPCATPALAVVLTIVALQKKILWGGVLLFAYALGNVCACSRGSSLVSG